MDMAFVQWLPRSYRTEGGRTVTSTVRLVYLPHVASAAVAQGGSQGQTVS